MKKSTKIIIASLIIGAIIKIPTFLDEGILFGIAETFGASFAIGIFILFFSWLFKKMTPQKSKNNIKTQSRNKNIKIIIT